MIDKMKNRSYRSNQILKIILSFTILVISLRYIGGIYQPTLLDDEFAYFGIAKYFTGTSWSSAMSLCKYYSYGYSLLLVPFTWIIKDTVLLYRVVVAMNGLFLAAAFLLIDSIFRQLTTSTGLSGKSELQEKDYNRITVVSFLMILLPCNMNYASVALAECLLLMLFALMVKLMLCLGKDSGCTAYVALGGIMMYSYMVHQRMLGVILAAVLVLGIRLLRKQVRVRQFFSYFVTVILLYGVHTLVKGNIKENLWLNGELSGQNDMAGILDNVREIFSSFSYFIKFIVGILGKLYYMESSTYLFGLVGLILLLLFIIRRFRMAELREAGKSTEAGVLFLVLSFFIVLGISAVFMNEPENMAFLLYGRYLETFSPFLMGYGILALMKAGENYKRYFKVLLGTGVIYGITGLIIRYFSKRWNLSWLNYISTGQLYRYLIGDAVPVLRIMLVVFVTAGMIYFVLRIRRFSLVSEVLLGIFMFCIFYHTAYIPMHKINLDLQQERHRTSQIAEVIENSLTDSGMGGKQVYYYVAEDEPSDTAQYRDYVQYWLDDIYLSCVSEQERDTWENLPVGALVLASCENREELELFQKNEMELIFENEICGVYRKGKD